MLQGKKNCESLAITILANKKPCKTQSQGGLPKESLHACDQTVSWQKERILADMTKWFLSKLWNM